MLFGEFQLVSLLAFVKAKVREHVFYNKFKGNFANCMRAVHCHRIKAKILEPP
jgi:hypothetical protein